MSIVPYTARKGKTKWVFIIDLGGSAAQINFIWLYRKDGLGLMYIIDELFEPYKTNLSQSEINNFFEGLKYLKLTNYPQSSISFQIRNKLNIGK